MGTEKRARQKQLHQTRREQAAREATRRARIRRLVTIVGAVVVVGAVMAGVSLLGDDNSDSAADDQPPTDTDATTTTLFPPVTGAGPAASVTGETPCPETDGSSPRTTSFESAPPTCIDPDATYTATFATSAGDFTAELDAASAPETVNNFVTLARYHYYDGIPFHRVVPNFVIQAGDPQVEPTGSGGPGYTIGEEPPDGDYEQYDLAMAKTPEPNSTGSQFFVVTGDPSALAGGGYSWFGRVTSGQNVVDLIGAIPTVGPSNDTPTQQVDIVSVTISES